MAVTVTRWPRLGQPTALTSPTGPAPTRNRCTGQLLRTTSTGMVPAAAPPGRARWGGPLQQRRRRAPVDGDQDPAQVARLRRREECHDRPELRGPPVSTERDLRLLRRARLGRRRALPRRGEVVE